MIPQIDQMLVSERLDITKIHDHTVVRLAILLNDLTGQGNLKGIAVTVQIATLAAVIGNAMTRIEFQLSGNR
ncbi:hypothetical protein UNDKW_2696 [Undibacterium sp. KW1]|nr:hypothetical protein UNDKW_2696 [Undibacterium sp. KW1]